MVVENWRHFNEKLYLLLAWVVMPNHVHVLLEVEAEASLGRIVHAWKSYTAKAIARVAQVSPPIWQADYWDRLVRDDQHLAAALDYIQSNPVKAGLVSRAEDWPWSSARNN